jgi:valyl-tRNA synthetase
VVIAIRNVRNEYKVDPRKPVTVLLSVPGTAAVEQTAANREMIELLATCGIEKIGSDLPQPPGSVRGPGDGFDVYALDLIDPDAQAKRIATQRVEWSRKAQALRNRLANPSYAEKAPPHLVRQTRDELAAAEAELAKLG